MRRPSLEVVDVGLLVEEDGALRSAFDPWFVEVVVAEDDVDADLLGPQNGLAPGRAAGQSCTPMRMESTHRGPT
jgi:hypothetical protein